MKLNVSLDFDNVLYDLELANCAFIKKHYGDIISPIDVNTWNFYPERYPRITEVLTKWEEYKKGEIYTGAVSFVKELQQMTSVQIVTASGSEEIEQMKDDFIFTLFGNVPVIHARNKSPFTKDSILVDDYFKNIVSHTTENSCPGIIFDRNFGWSKEFDETKHPLISRTGSYEDILNFVESSLKRS